MIIKTKATVTKIKLPQLAMNNIRERSTRHSYAKSLNPSQSPISKMMQPTTPITSSHKNSYYDYRNIMKIDSTPATDIEMFNSLYKQAEPTPLNKGKESSLKRMRKCSNENFQNVLAISRDPRRSAPDLNLYPNYLSKPQQQNETRRKEIREKIMDIYRQVEKLLQNHKGYVRQIDKKQTVVTLVKLRKEFLLLNQDYNDFYVLPKTEPDVEFRNRMDMLIKLFQPNKLKKSNRINMFDFDDSFNNNTVDQSQIMQFLSDQMSDLENITSSQQSQTNLSEASGQISQSKRNAQSIRTHKQSVIKQPRGIVPIESQQTQQDTETSKQPRQSFRQEMKEPKQYGQRKYNKLNIEDIEKKELPNNNNIKYSDNEEPNSEQGTEQASDTKRRLKRETKITRRNAMMGEGKEEKKNYRINTDGQMVSICNSDAEKSSDNRRQSEETNRNGLENREDLLSNQEQIEEILNQVENDFGTYQRVQFKDKQRVGGKGAEFNMENQQTVGRIQRQQQNRQEQGEKLKASQIYKTEPEFVNQKIDETGLIEALYNCEYIYDSRILDFYRIEKQYTSWDDDIDFILCDEYQFN